MRNAILHSIELNRKVPRVIFCHVLYLAQLLMIVFLEEAFYELPYLDKEVLIHSKLIQENSLMPKIRPI